MYTAHRPFFRHALPYLCVFLLALGASLAHNFLEPNTRTVFFADSRNYQRSSNYVCTAILDAIKGKDVRPYLQKEHVAARIKDDGPILSTVMASIFAVIGHAPESRDWKIFVAIQCIIHALTAALVVALTRSFVASSRVATAAGIVFALYPGGIIASGRVMTESFSCLLCTLYVLLLLATTRRLKWAPFCGLVGGLAWTMKAILIPPVIAAVLFLVSKRKLKAVSTAVIVAGILVIVSPWAYFSKNFLQRTMITTERASVHNAYIGWDTETDGFQASFPTPKENILLVFDPISVIWGQILSDPVGCTLLTVKKFARFYGLPFNDFRHSCFGIPSLALIPIHLFCLFAGGLGIVMYALGGFRRLSPEERLACNLTLVVLFFMQCFFLFEASTRYGYTVFPFLTALGGLGFWLAWSLFKEKNWLRLSLGVATTSALVFFVAQSEAIVNLKAPIETAHTLLSGAKAVAEIDLNIKGRYLGPDYALVLVDGDEGLSRANVKVNGNSVKEKLLPLPYFDSLRFSQFNLMKEYGYGLNVPVEKLRKWRAAIIPVVWLNIRGKNTIEIIARDKLTVHGDRQADFRRFRSLDTVCVNRLLYTPTDLEARPFEPTLSAGVKKTFLLDSQLSGKQTLSAERLRIYVALLAPANRSTLKTSVGNEKSLQKALKPEDFPFLMRNPVEGDVTTSKFIVAHSTTSMSTRIPPYKDATHVRITLSGEIKGATENSCAGIAITAGGDTDSFFMLGSLPYSTAATIEWKPFTISDLLPLDAFKGRATQIDIGIYPGPWPEIMGLGPALASGQTFFKNLNLKIEPVASLDLRGSKLMLY